MSVTRLEMDTKILDDPFVEHVDGDTVFLSLCSYERIHDRLHLIMCMVILSTS